MRLHSKRGFTLIEIMAALAILSLSVFILLQAHVNALNLHSTMVDEVTMRQLTETALARAEADVLLGTFSGAGDFGMRFPDYSWSYEASLSGGYPEVLLYEVNVSITGPEDTRSLSFFTYNIGQPEEGADGGMFDRTSQDNQGASRAGSQTGSQSGPRSSTGLRNSGRGSIFD